MSYTDVAPTSAPAQGDERVAFRLNWVVSPEGDDLKAPISVAVIRHGPNLAIYKAISASPPAWDVIPSDLVNAQSKVLDAAGRSAAD
ncbi:hypothetical protein [Streptomyces sp. NPDC006309]|uniref:hypothetical protein n=1 Tax=Streptomyces sp. NPDC006309 TaxID=3156749 RepID=UPI0033BD5EE2